MLIPFILIIYSIHRKKIIQKSYLFLLSAMAVIIFLSKGIGGVFGEIYKLMILRIPGFSIFKSANEKWGVLLIFIFTLSLAIMFLREEKDRYKYKMYLIFFVYLLFISIPFISGDIIPDYHRDVSFISSRYFLDKREYQDTRNKLNNDDLLYRVLALPGSGNYQVALKMENGKFYTGNDPILSNTNKPFIGPYNGSFAGRFPVLFKGISDDNYLKLMGIFNIKKIIINKDEEPWFGFVAKESVNEIEKILDKKLISETGEAIDIYDTGEYFLPRIYSPITIVQTEKSVNNALEIISQSDSDDSRTAILFDGMGKDILFNPDWKRPKISFTRINPSKYKVRVEGADDPYLLVLSESFHSGWKVYLNPEPDLKLWPNIKSYFKGDIIENTDPFNLVDSFFNETWNKKALPESLHFVGNGYANSWVIKPENVDGQTNYELIIEYWPQRLFYGGLLVSALGFIITTSLILARSVFRLARKIKNT